MKLFLDTNVILDVLADREPFAEDATVVLSAIERDDADGFIAAHTVTTLFYLLERTLSLRKAKRAVADLLKLLEVVPVDHDRLLQALAMNWKDFEDALQAACSAKADVDYFVTRNPSDFSGVNLDVVTPVEMRAVLTGRD
ncbi:MAG TPA: PIN domain-containing protein [Rhodothermales bacterium]|nr:PIN domain-containing protein [Rhodothermales bacterium]